MVLDDRWLTQQRSDGALVLHAVAASVESAIALHEESMRLLKSKTGVARAPPARPRLESRRIVRPCRIILEPRTLK